MVSKSYVVNECPRIIDDNDNSVSDARMHASDQMTKIDRYILHISNEMVSSPETNRTVSARATREKRKTDWRVCSENN